MGAAGRRNFSTVVGGQVGGSREAAVTEKRSLPASGQDRADFEREKWVEIYQNVLLELEHAKMRGRIGDARTAIRACVEKLKEIPDLHDREYLAIDDALNSLRFLERREERYDEN